ncbi:hypothetical protein DFJ73DRAFT_780386 [Zopfochytrium polystomum]|nr:hypothetical protein DFJ73DRAFT_780386 [Zopfochytrium polystomum]
MSDPASSAMAPAVTDADNNNNDGEAVVVDVAINKLSRKGNYPSAASALKAC